MHLSDAALDGQRRAVGQPRFERATDPLDGVVVWAVARPVQHLQPGVLAQPALHDLGAVDDHVVADHRHHRRRGVGGQQLLAEGGEGGADGLAGDLVVEAPVARSMAPKMVRRRFFPGGHDLLAAAVGDPGRPYPGQQVDVGLVLGQHHRALGQVADGLPQVGEDLVAVGVALGDQVGPPPAGDLADPPVQGPQRDRGRPAARHSRPIVQALGWPSSRRIRLVSVGPPSRGLPERGRSASPALPWVW
jgi:hypothetical protein